MSEGEGEISADPANVSGTPGLGFVSMFATNAGGLDPALANMKPLDTDDLLARRGRLADRSGSLLINTRVSIERDESTGHELVIKVPAAKRLVVEYLCVVATAPSVPVAHLLIRPSPLPEDPDQLVDQQFVVPLDLHSQLASRQFQHAQLTRLYADGPKELLFFLELLRETGGTFPDFPFPGTRSPARAWATLLLSGWVSEA